jgi:hypothetical protein
MDNSDMPNNMSRRQFLTTGGIVAAAALVPSPLMSAASAMMVGRVRTAVLLPDFTLAPEAGAIFSNAFAESTDSRFGVQTLSTGRGLTSQAMAATREALDGGAHVIVAYINDNDADDLLALTEAAGAGLLVINHGENIPRANFTSPRFARASLNKWMTEYENGRYVGEGYHRPVMITSFYESGFDAHYAFRIGFESIGRNSAELSHFVFRNEAEFLAILATVERINPDIVYAGFDGADFALYERVWKLSTPTITAGMHNVTKEFTHLGEITAAALNRWDGAKFAPDLAVLPQHTLEAAVRHAQTVKTGWLHPYMTL